MAPISLGTPDTTTVCLRPVPPVGVSTSAPCVRCSNAIMDAPTGVIPAPITREDVVLIAQAQRFLICVSGFSTACGAVLFVQSMQHVHFGRSHFALLIVSVAS